MSAPVVEIVDGIARHDVAIKSREPREGERCRCGRVAVIVFIAEHEDVPYCGVPDRQVSA